MYDKIKKTFAEWAKGVDAVGESKTKEKDKEAPLSPILEYKKIYLLQQWDLEILEVNGYPISYTDSHNGENLKGVFVWYHWGTLLKEYSFRLIGPYHHQYYAFLTMADAVKYGIYMASGRAEPSLQNEENIRIENATKALNRLKKLQ